MYLKCHFFFFFDKLKYKIRNKDFVSLDWDIKHKVKWFFGFQITEHKIKFEIHFSFFVLIWKTKNQIYLKKYLIKLVIIFPYLITINKYKTIK